MKTHFLQVDLDHILDHTLQLWEDLRGERIFITGATGFFGHWLLESFLWANLRLHLKAKATVLTRHPDIFIANSPHLAVSDSITLLSGDIRDFAFPIGTFSHVIHAATDASARLNTENPLLMLDTITEGTRRVLDFSISCSAKRFLLTSSGAVYGKQPPNLTRFPEDYSGAPDPLDPKSAYGQGKRLAEHFCALYGIGNPASSIQNSSGIQIKIARGFAFVGPYLPLDIHFAIGNFIRSGLNGEPITITGDGTPRRSYLYAADLAIWLWTILFRGQHLHPYNVGSEKSQSISEIANITAACFDQNIQIVIQKQSEPGRPIERYVPQTSRARSELGLDEWVDLRSGILRTIAWHNNRNHYSG